MQASMDNAGRLDHIPPALSSGLPPLPPQLNLLNLGFPKFRGKTTMQATSSGNSKTLDGFKEPLEMIALETVDGGSFHSVGAAGNTVHRRLPQLSEVKRLHASMMESGKEFRLSEENTLMDMYVKYGSMADARHVFDNIPRHSVVSWNVLILGYAKWEQGALALDLYSRMNQDGVQPIDRTFVAALKACSSLAAVKERKLVDGKDVKIVCLEKGRAIHSQLMKSGFESNVFIRTSLVDMYMKCQSMEDAHHIFDTLPHPDVVLWTTIILGYAQNEHGALALKLYAQMLKVVQPNDRTFVAALKACSSLAALEERKRVDGKFVKILSLEKGRAIHSQVVKGTLESDKFVGTVLVDVYVKCGSMEDAWHVFSELPHHDVISWTSIIMGCAQKEGALALKLYSQMHQEGVQPDRQTSACALKACCSLAALEERKQVGGKCLKAGCLEKGRIIHSQAVTRSFESDVVVGTTLLNMYAKCGSMEDAQHVFFKLPHRDVASWTTMIAGYAQNEEGELALELYTQMHQEIALPNYQTFVAILKACSSLAGLEKGIDVDKNIVKIECLEKGRVIHSQAIQCGCESNVFVGTSLVDLYAKCGDMEDAWHVFHELPHRDVACWTSMISACAHREEGGLALELYTQMQEEGILPDHRTFVSALKACGSLAALDDFDAKIVKIGCLEKGRAIHCQAVKNSFELDAFVATGLVDMYVKCGRLEDACNVFDRIPHRNLISWTAMIMGHAQKGEGVLALELYAQMHKEAVRPDRHTFVAALLACSSLAAVEEGKQVDGKSMKIRCLEKGRAIHIQTVVSSFESDIFVVNSMVDMYAKCGSTEDARHEFDKFPHRDVVSWNTMISGYAEQDENEEALQLYAQMQEQGLSADSVTFISILKVCSSSSALKTGKEVHLQICMVGFESSVIVANSLIDMYGKCGSMVDAQYLFDSLPTRHFVTWNALITGYARQGNSEHVFHLFEKMKFEGIQPNGITFLSVLNACNHAGLVEEGQRYFQTMSKQFNILPTIEHYNCMIDLFGRAGHIEDALAVTKKMPFQPNLVSWVAVLGACERWRNVEVGRYAFEHVVRLDQRKSAAYVLMSNIYVHAGMWEDYGKIQVMRKSSNKLEVWTELVN